MNNLMMNDSRQSLLPGEMRPHETWLHRNVRPCLAEFLGTALFIFVGTMSTNNGNPLLAVALSHAFSLCVLVASTAQISGAHFNPAVSIGVYFAGGIGFFKLTAYITCQLIGAMTGAGMTRLALPYHVYVNVSGGGTVPGSHVSVTEAIFCEAFLTTILLLTVLMTALDSESRSSWAPLAIGLCVGGNIIAGGAISGASMNPARSFGPAVVAFDVGDQTSNKLWDTHYVYWVGPIMGACFAAFWYRLLLAGPEKNVVFRSRS